MQIDKEKSSTERSNRIHTHSKAETDVSHQTSERQQTDKYSYSIANPTEKISKMIENRGKDGIIQGVREGVREVRE